MLIGWMMRLEVIGGIEGLGAIVWLLCVVEMIFVSGLSLVGDAQVSRYKRGVTVSGCITEQQWNQWLAGLLDGDGYCRNKWGKVVLTGADEDRPMFEHIINVLGSHHSLMQHVSAKSISVEFGVSELLGDIVNRLNGYVRISVRAPE